METSTDILGSKLFSTLVTIPKNTASLYYLSIVSSLYLLVLGLVDGPHPYFLTYISGYGCGCFLRSPPDTVMIATRITLLVRIVGLSSHARVTL